MLKRITSKNAAGAALNEVFRQLNEWGLLMKEYQDHDSEVDTQSTPKVEYTYTSGWANHVRLTDVTYPNQRRIHYDYSSTGGSHDDALGRVTSISDVYGSNTSDALASYTYLGLGQVLEVDYKEPDLRYDMAHQDTSGQYDRIDRFGRVTDLTWVDYQPDPDEPVVRIKHGYDRAGNRLWRQDVEAASANLDELYSYDGMYQLTSLRRGLLNGTYDGFETGTENLAQGWTLDTLGNWTEFKEGPAAGTWTTLDQDRVHNAANEIDVDNSHANDPGDSITASTGTDWANPKLDAAGNMTLVPKPNDLGNGYTLKYDAWNRLVKVSTGSGETETVVAEHRYDGLNRRVIKKTYNSQGQLTETRDFYQSADNQVLEERIEGRSVADRQYVWGLRYVDDLVLRDRDSDGDGVAGEGSLGKTDSALDERRYAMQDANWNVVAIADTSGVVQERYTYKAYGKVEYRTGTFGDRSSSSYAWTVLYTGRDLDAETGLYYYRARYYSAELGRFVGRDPVGYAARDANLYR